MIKCYWGCQKTFWCSITGPQYTWDTQSTSSNPRLIPWRPHYFPHCPCEAWVLKYEDWFKQTVLKVCTINKHEQNHALQASSASGFTQRSTARWATRRCVTTMFHAVLWNGPIRIVVGQNRHKCSHVKPLTFFTCFAFSSSIRSAIF